MKTCLVLPHMAVLALLQCALTLPTLRMAAADDGEDGEDGENGDEGDEDGDNEESGDDKEESGDDNDDLYDDQYIDWGMQWSDYAVMPKKCISYNGEDVIVYSIYEDESKQCSNKPVGTYYSSVAEFVTGYINQKTAEAELTQNDEYEEPEVLDYMECTEYELYGVDMYVKVGCKPDSSQRLAMITYQDEYCSQPTAVNYNLNMNGFKLPFLQCQNCVNWFSINDDALDDQYYNIHGYDSPMCYRAWTYKADCDRKCLKLGYDPSTRREWTGGDKFMLFTLSLFGIVSILAIYKQRKKMSRKDVLLEEAAITNAGMKRIHVAAMILLYILLLIILMIARAKKLTWFLLVMIDLVLFAYLVNLMITSRRGKRRGSGDAEERSVDYEHA